MCPEQGREIPAARVRDAVGAKGGHIDVLRNRPRYFEFNRVPSEELPDSDYRLTVQDQKSLDLPRMIVVAPRNARLRGGDETLAAVDALDRLEQLAARVTMHLQRHRVVFRVQIGSIGIEQVQIHVLRELRDKVPTIRPVEPLQLPEQVRDGHRRAGQPDFSSRPTLDGRRRLFRHRLSVDQFESPVLNNGRLLPRGQLMAERGDDGIVERSSALPVHIGDDEIGKDGAGILRPRRQKFSAAPFRSAICSVSLAMSRVGQHDLRMSFSLSAGGYQLARQVDIDRFDFTIIAAVHPRKMDNDVRFPHDLSKSTGIPTNRSIDPDQLHFLAGMIINPQMPAKEAVDTGDSNGRHMLLLVPLMMSRAPAEFQAGCAAMPRPL